MIGNQPDIGDWSTVNSQGKLLLGKVTAAHGDDEGMMYFWLYIVEYYAYMMFEIDEIELVHSSEEGLAYDLQYSDHF